MDLSRILHLFRDLIQVLPTTARREWVETKSLDPQKPTVILVSGFAATRRTLAVIRRRLLRDGFNVIILALDWHTLSDGVRGLYRMAEKLSSIVLEVRKKKGMRKSKVFLVTHSAGGLVARHYIQQLGGWHYCDALVTMATPHQGTWIAALGLFTHLLLKARCLMQITPRSQFVRRINASPYPQGFPMLSIHSKDDWLCPKRSTRLPLSLRVSGHVEEVDLKGLSHSDFLMSKEVYSRLHTFLTEALVVPVESPKASPGLRKV